MIPVFLHGLESSSKGTKGSWFAKRFPEMLMIDLAGSLDERLRDLSAFVYGRNELVLVGSSFGGLVASVYAIEHSSEVAKAILMAPALNFHEFDNYRQLSTKVPATLYTGENDTVCPPEQVISAAEDVFTNLTVYRVDDDHFLHKTFTRIDWSSLI